MNEKVLVSGGVGFIGSHLVDELCKKNFQVIVLDNLVGGKQNVLNFPKGVEFIKGDICDRRICKKLTKDVKTVFHLAAHAAEGQSTFVPIFNAQTNLMGSITLLTEAINNSVENFVFTSSIAVYGKPKELPIKETAPLNPEDPYGITKMAFENYLRVFYELGAIKPFIVRFFNVYGPRQRMDDPYRGVIPIFINRILRKEKPIIFGDGSQKRAFTYISDIVEPMVEIVKHKKLINNPVNIGSEKPYSVKELSEIILEKMDSKIAIEFVQRRESDVPVVYCDVSKAKKLMRYEPKVSLEEGLNRTIEWATEFGAQEFKYMDYFEIDRLRHDVYRKRKI